MTKLLITLLLTLPLVASAATPTLPQALAATHDIWGDASLQSPDGPTYQFFADLLPPLRYVNTSFRQYPLALSAPLSAIKARLISNGSGVNLPAHTPTWSDYPLGVTIQLGSPPETFGVDPARLTGPTFELGYLPIVHTSYHTPTATVSQEAFVPATGPLAANGGVLIRLSSTSTLPITLTTDSKTDNHLLWLDANWTSNANQITANLTPDHPLLFAVFSNPIEKPETLGALDENAYQSMRANCIAEWESWLARCMTLDVPEERVNRAWKSLVIANLMMTNRDQMCYSTGNAYKVMYEAESGDAVRALMLFGLTDEARRMTDPLLRFTQAGLEFHNAAFKLQLLSHLYWITRDAQMVRDFQPLWQPAVDTIVNRREKQTGLLPKENYCADINTQVYSLNSNANAWRGLRDISSVLRDIGSPDQAKPLESAASDFRTAIRAALAKSQRNNFIPIALFGAESPYDHLTDTKLGSYWDLMIPYVLGSGILDDTQTSAALDYLQTHGGLCMGMIRFDQHSGLFANEKGLDDLYTLRYTQSLLDRDDVDHALVSFYGKLAQGMTPDTFVDGEGSSLVPLDPAGRPMYLPPNASGNAFFLNTLRNLLVQDIDQNNDGVPDTLRLLFATPKFWAADGKSITLKNAPTSFGPISLTTHSDLSHGHVTVHYTPPPHPPEHTQLRLRLPAGWHTLDRATRDLPPSPSPLTIDFAVARD